MFYFVVILLLVLIYTKGILKNQLQLEEFGNFLSIMELYYRGLLFCVKPHLLKDSFFKCKDFLLIGINPAKWFYIFAKECFGCKQFKRKQKNLLCKKLSTFQQFQECVWL